MTVHRVVVTNACDWGRCNSKNCSVPSNRGTLQNSSVPLLMNKLRVKLTTVSIISVNKYKLSELCLFMTLQIDLKERITLSNCLLSNNTDVLVSYVPGHVVISSFCTFKDYIIGILDLRNLPQYT